MHRGQRQRDAARYLNINGTIQSGIPNGVTAYAGATVAFNGGNGSFAQPGWPSTTRSRRARSRCWGRVLRGHSHGRRASGNSQGAWEPVTVRYNAKREPAGARWRRCRAGYIELFRQIFNTNQVGGGSCACWTATARLVAIETRFAAVAQPAGHRPRRVRRDQHHQHQRRGRQRRAGVHQPQYSRGSGAARRLASWQPGGRFCATRCRWATTGTDEYHPNAEGLVRHQGHLHQPGAGPVPAELDRALQRPAVPRQSSWHHPRANGTYFSRTQTQTTSNVVTPGRSWKSCNWWTLCANATYYQEFSISRPPRRPSWTACAPTSRPHPVRTGFDQGSINAVDR